MDASERWLAFAVAMIILLLVTLFYPLFAYGHEHGRTDKNWEQMSDEEREWIKSLKMADAPTQSCCGEADQYWADKTFVRDGRVYAVITDDRPDEWFLGPSGYPRPHMPVGTEVEIPPEKMKFGPNDKSGQPPGNLSGHNLVFMSASKFVYCFILSTGG